MFAHCLIYDNEYVLLCLQSPLLITELLEDIIYHYNHFKNVFIYTLHFYLT